MFYFKQFSIDDNNATMKVGTDAVLLGALAGEDGQIREDVAPRNGDKMNHSPLQILDVGTGCGVIALMMAQRFGKSKVDAIDIDEITCRVAEGNFKRSAWGNRLTVRNMSVQELAGEVADEYDIIVSNPPFFNRSLPNEDQRKRLARHDTMLPSEELFSCAYQLLRPGGLLAIITPLGEKDRMCENASMARLACTKMNLVSNRKSDVPKRAIVQFVKDIATRPEVKVESSYMTSEGGERSEWYKTLVKPFLLG